MPVGLTRLDNASHDAHSPDTSILGLFNSSADFDKGGGRLELLPIRGPTKEEALAFLEKVNLLTAADDPATRAKMTLVAELVGDRFTLVQKVARAARGANVTQQGG